MRFTIAESFLFTAAIFLFVFILLPINPSASVWFTGRSIVRGSRIYIHSLTVILVRLVHFKLITFIKYKTI